MVGEYVVVMPKGMKIMSRWLRRSARLTRQVLVVALAVTTVISTSGRADAQTNSVTDENGFQPNRDYLSLQPWESIDTASGNVILTFTDLELPGNSGRSLRFEHTFNNQRMAVSPDTQWRFSLSGLPMKVSIPPTIPVNASMVNSIDGERFWNPWFEMADGSSQGSNFLMDPDVSSAFERDRTTTWVITPQLWRYNRQTRYLYLPDGVVAHYDASGLLDFYIDSFSNLVELIRSPGALLVQQHLGGGQRRDVTFTMNDTLRLPTSMTFDGKTWLFEHDSGDPGRVRFIRPPAGRPWEVKYDPSNPGRVYQVVTPAGGTVDYRYDWKEFVYSPTYRDLFLTLISRTAKSGPLESIWSFDYMTSGPGGSLAGMIATLPSGRRALYSYAPGDEYMVSGGWRLDGVLIYAPGGTVVIDEEYRDYQGLLGVRSNRLWYAPTLSKRRIVRDGRSYETEYVFDLTATNSLNEYHQPRHIIERTAGETRRTTTRHYRHYAPAAGQAGPYVVGLTLDETVADSAGSVVRAWDYNSTGFRISETAQGSTTIFTPSVQGNVQRITRGNGKWTQHTYSWGMVAETTTSEPGYGVTKVNNLDGTVASETRAGRTTTFEYDDIGRIEAVRPPGGTNPTITAYTDNTFGQTVTVTRGGASLATTTDGFGKPIGTLNGVGVRTTTRYDEDGRVTYKSLPFLGTSGGPSDKGTTITYDHYGRVIKEQNADGTERERTYSNDTVTTYDENGHDSLLTYRPFGHPEDAVLVGVRDANGESWSYTYNVVGGLTRVDAPGGVTRTWNYHPDTYLLLSENHPESGTVTYTNYDAAGVLKGKTDDNGNTFVYSHDGNDRLVGVTANGASVMTTTYETGSDNRIATTSDGVSTSFGYETLTGRLASRTDVVDGKSFAAYFDYDNNDNVRTVMYPSERRVAYEYDSENRVSRVYNGYNSGQTWASSFTYHPSGGLATYTAAGVNTTIDYHPTRHWVSGVHSGPLSLTYDYDDVGNIDTITDSRSSYNQAFAYDPLDRLWTATSPMYGSYEFLYDAHGNRRTSATGTYTYISGKPFHLETASGISGAMGYDDNGNLTSGPGVTYAYGPGNQLRTSTVSGKVVNFNYDADDGRVKKQVTGTGGVTTYFTRGPKGELLSEWINASPQATVKDHIYVGARLISVAEAAKPTK
jgi:YD repeat-containing protein